VTVADRSTATMLSTDRLLLGLGVALALGFTGCGESTDGGRSADQGAGSVRSASAVARAHAPLVRIDRDERAYPMSADRFLDASGLEWGGGRCRLLITDVAAGPLARGLQNTPVPALDPRKLGHEPAYRARATDATCGHLDEVYTSTQLTRPHDRRRRPAGLRVDEGFNLDILTERQGGMRRLSPNGSLTGVPVYVHQSTRPVKGKPGVRLSYWLLFGSGETPGASGALVVHEGDWERIDVLLRAWPGRRRYEPTAIEYRHAGKLTRLSWGEVATDPTGAHPVIYLGRSTHTPSPTAPASGRKRWVAWKTWRAARDVTREPWYGYGGGWGAIDEVPAASGPLGPTPFELGPTMRGN
jgi:hypothetical protein